MCRGGGEGPAPHDCHHQSVHLSLCPGPGTVLRGEYASVARTQPMSWERSLRNMCAVQCDKCSERDESRRPWHPEEGAPPTLPAETSWRWGVGGRPLGLEGGRVVQAGEGLLAFWNPEFDVAQRVAFKLILDCSPQ